MFSAIWALTAIVLGLFGLLALIACWYDGLGVAPTGRVDSQKVCAAVAVPSCVPRLRLVFAMLLATSLIESDHLISRTKVVARDSMVVATSTTESVHDRVRIELPRIITWRPLPVTAPSLRRRARPRAAPSPNPKSG